MAQGKPASSPNNNGKGPEGLPIDEFVAQLKEALKDKPKLAKLFFPKENTANPFNISILLNLFMNDKLPKEAQDRLLGLITESKKLQKQLRELIEKKDGLGEIMKVVDEIKKRIDEIRGGDDGEDGGGTPPSDSPPPGESS